MFQGTTVTSYLINNSQSFSLCVFECVSVVCVPACICARVCLHTWDCVCAVM